MGENPSPIHRLDTSIESAGRRRLWWLGALAALIALSFAAYTNHTWEDYYITFRSSKNLATGEGLVYQPGERVHTFTSPLGVLLPALSSLLTFNRSDAAALWLFRVMCAGAFGAAVVGLGSFALRQRYGRIGVAVLLGLFMTDAKSVDFSINGMETAWMLLFLAWMLEAAGRDGVGAWRRLGLAWAGLMWTRPDSFVYIGAFALARWLFPFGDERPAARRRWMVACLKAGGLTTVIYLPWIVFAGLYYGTPVPHTIAAKSMINDPVTLGSLLSTVATFPLGALEGRLALDSTFLPAYSDMGGWPGWITMIGRMLGMVCALVWLAPGVRSEAKAASFTFFCAQIFLWRFPNHPFPWYLPSATLFAIVTLSGLVDQGLRFASWLETTKGAERIGRGLRLYLAAGVVLLIAGSGALLWSVARQAEAHQRLVEDGNRRQVGLWLRENAGPGDTVFMEPLGYIGYFSGLKTLDFPGMSAPETVAARKLFTNDFPMIISWLEPTWLVLRPHEIDGVVGRDRGIAGGSYRVVKTFSVADEVQKLDVSGLPYLLFDSQFVILQRQRISRFETESGILVSPFAAERTDVEGQKGAFLHSPGAWVVSIPPEAGTVRLKYGFLPNAHEGGNSTDGVDFMAYLAGKGRPQILHHRFLDPVDVAEDRGLHRVEIALPDRTDAATLVLRSAPHLTTNYDWTVWAEPEFAP